MVHCDPDLKAKVKENRIGVMLGFYYPYLGTLTTHVLERRPAILFLLDTGRHYRYRRRRSNGGDNKHISGSTCHMFWPILQCYDCHHRVYRCGHVD